MKTAAQQIQGSIVQLRQAIEQLRAIGVCDQSFALLENTVTELAFLEQELPSEITLGGHVQCNTCDYAYTDPDSGTKECMAPTNAFCPLIQEAGFAPIDEIEIRLPEFLKRQAD